MADLVERARREGSGRGELDGDATDALLLELADEIERLRGNLTREQGQRLTDNMTTAKQIVDLEAELERLTAALREIAEHRIDSELASREKRNMARAALGGK